MANEQNLIPFTERSESEVREMNRKGGINSGKSRREKADLRKVLQLWMATNVTNDENGEPVTGAQFMAQVAVREMAEGNPKFWELLRDTAGFKPVDKVEQINVDAEYTASVDYVNGLMEDNSGTDDGDGANEGG